MSNTQTPRQPGKRAQNARFLVSVDGQTKSSYPNREDADAEALRISSKFTNLAVRVSDSEEPMIRESTAVAQAEAQ